MVAPGVDDATVIERVIQPEPPVKALVAAR
jgi:hypothetical protein